MSVSARPARSGVREEGWENLAFIVSAYESMEKRAPVDIPEFRR